MDVFISYSRKDREHKDPDGEDVISRIQNCFRENGITFWLDEEGIRSGEPFGSVISRNIVSSKVFLFVSSSNSNASRWICGEIATASTYEKCIIPFRIDNTPYNSSIAIYVAALDAINYEKDADKAIRKLIDSVKSYLNEVSALRQSRDHELKTKYAQQFEALVDEQIRMQSELNAKEARIEALAREKDDLTRQLEAVKKKVTTMSKDPGTVHILEEDTRICYYLEHLTDTLFHLKGDFQPIDQDSVDLGREAKCQVRYDEACTTVSRHHARISRVEGMWKVFNVSRTNQTFVNGKAVPPGGVILNAGDEIRLAQSGPSVRFVFPEKKRKKQWWLIGLIAIAVLSCLVLIAHFMHLF